MIKTSFRIYAGANRRRAVMLSAPKDKSRRPIYIWKEWISGYQENQTARGSCDAHDLPRYISLNIDSNGPNKWHEWPMFPYEGVRHTNRRAQ